MKSKRSWINKHDVLKALRFSYRKTAYIIKQIIYSILVANKSQYNSGVYCVIKYCYLVKLNYKLFTEFAY